MITAIRSIEKIQNKYIKIIPTFAKINVSIENTVYKPSWKISLLVMNAELENKYLEKHKFKIEIKKICKE